MSIKDLRKDVFKTTCGIHPGKWCKSWQLDRNVPERVKESPGHEKLVTRASGVSPGNWIEMYLRGLRSPRVATTISRA